MNELKPFLEMIENGENNYLLEKNITPSSDREVSKRQFVITHFLVEPGSGIHQFRDGISSVSPNMMAPKHYGELKDLFQNERKVSANEFFGLFNFVKNGEQGSNSRNLIENIICDFEIFLNSIGSGEVKDNDGKVLGLHDVLFLLTALDRIPPFGFEKKIDVFFSNEISFPKISTCSLNLTLPVGENVSIEHMLLTAISFGSGFGEV